MPKFPVITVLHLCAHLRSLALLIASFCTVLLSVALLCAVLLRSVVLKVFKQSATKRKSIYNKRSANGVPFDCNLSAK